MHAFQCFMFSLRMRHIGPARQFHFETIFARPPRGHGGLICNRLYLNELGSIRMLASILHMQGCEGDQMRSKP